MITTTTTIFEYLLNSTNQSAKPADLKGYLLHFNDTQFHFLISYTLNALIDMVEILFSWEKKTLKRV